MRIFTGKKHALPFLQHRLHFEDDPAAPGGGGGDPAPAGDPAPTGDLAADWKTHISEELRADKGLDTVNSLEDLTKGYLSGQRMLGNSVRIPGKDAAPEDTKAFHDKLEVIGGVVRIPETDDQEGWNALYAKMGRPPTVDEYNYEKPENHPEGMEYSEELQKGFLEMGHKIGLTKQQAHDTLNWYSNMNILGFEDSETKKEEAGRALKVEWGSDYTRRASAARQLIDKYGNEEINELFDSTGFGNDPRVLKMLSNIGMATLEDSVIDAGLTSASLTPPEINEKIAELRNHPAYMDQFDPQHKSIVDKVQKLYKDLSALSG